MGNYLWSFLSRDWAGLAIAGLVATPGWWLLKSGCTLAAYPVIALAALLGIGALVHLFHMSGVRRKFPPPGKLVDIGGYRIHLLAEGSNNGRATVVWLPGGHTGGAGLHHMHDLVRNTTRSILIDRPGTGWSDAGPFPRTTLRETTEIVLALEKAGEKPPFVLAGHSFGGLLAANIARARPDLVSCLALIDPTPPETIMMGPRHPALKMMRRISLVQGLLGVFGIHINFQERSMRQSANPALRKLLERMRANLGTHWDALQAVEATPQANFASMSIFQELSGEGMARAAWDIAVYDGDLDPMPVFLIAPGDFVELEENRKQLGVEGKEAARVARFYAKSRERYLATSTNARRIYAPKGTGHNFPMEVPEFLAGVIIEAAEVGHNA